MDHAPRCLLVNPEFASRSFWNYTATCDLVGAAYPAAPLGLITVAALLPGSWDCRLVDCNVEKLRDEEIEWAEIVLTGGMIAQQRSTLRLVERLKRSGKTVVVGGPDPTSSPHLYGEADSLVLGEAELTLPRWLADLESGTTQAVYECGDSRADMTTSPVPRFDLLRIDRYLHVGVQLARGCPFKCEFCDIIELFGRVPRLKSSEQMLGELDRLYRLGYRGHVDFVDDNFIGNKKHVKKFLEALHEWLVARSWPFEFSTEASINLADDEELLRLMQQVGFSAIFVGIESPDEAVLKGAHKRQNLGRSLLESLRKIYSHGMFVNAGYIVGLDNEQGSVAQGVLEFIEASAVPANMVGLLFALPRTELARRLAREGRLLEDFDVAPHDHGDQCTAGLNFVTMRPRVEILRDYRRIIAESYAPEAYYDRVLRLAAMLDCSEKNLRLPWRERRRELRGFGRLLWRRGIKGRGRGLFWRTVLKLMWRHPQTLRYTIALVALFAHFDSFRDYVLGELDDAIRREEKRGGQPIEPTVMSERAEGPRTRGGMEKIPGARMS